MDTVPTYTKGSKCRRCNGSGVWSHYGICFGCQGTGFTRVQSGTRPLTVEEQAKADKHRAGIAAREAREVARKARRAAREGS